MSNTENKREFLDIQKSVRIEILRNKDVLTLKEADVILSSVGDDDLLSEIVKMREQLVLEEWLKILGKYWFKFKSIWKFKDDLDLGLQMMTKKEVAELAALKQKVTIYRACFEFNMSGLCWLKDMTSASQLANCYFAEARSQQVLVLVAEVPKFVIRAVKMDEGRFDLLARVSKSQLTSILYWNGTQYAEVCKKRFSALREIFDEQ